MVLLLGLMVVVGAPLAERDVRGVVDGWLAAQNAGDPAGYDKLYAAKFTGILVLGCADAVRSRRLDADRLSMLSRNSSPRAPSSSSTRRRKFAGQTAHFHDPFWASCGH